MRLGATERGIVNDYLITTCERCGLEIALDAASPLVGQAVRCAGCHRLAVSEDIIPIEEHDGLPTDIDTSSLYTSSLYRG